MGNPSAVLTVAPRERLLPVLRFTTARGNIATIDVIADPGRLREFDLALSTTAE